MRTKNAYSDVLEVITDSWTFKRMTDEEQLNVRFLIDMSLTSQERLETEDEEKYLRIFGKISDIYRSCLSLMGYNVNNGDWRNPKDEPLMLTIDNHTQEEIIRQINKGGKIVIDLNSLINLIE